MDAKQAVGLAKDYIKDIFSSEAILQVGLEEVEFDEHSDTWFVTIGFSRFWDSPANAIAAIAQQARSSKRSYKVVKINDLTGKVTAVKNRETQLWTESA